jgi:aromatic ring-opening dioxygenase catalytic subunit (LigB family)
MLSCSELIATHPYARPVNDVSKTPLIYDFYNFPAHYYKQTFEAVSQPWLVELVKGKLAEGGVGVTGVGGKGRGLDHGAWGTSSDLPPDGYDSDG